MKYSLLFAACAFGLVFANPHKHRTVQESVAKKGGSDSTSAKFRAGSMSGDSCPCNHSWSGTACVELQCGDAYGNPVCGSGCVSDYSAITEGGLDPHVLTRHHKVCRFNNDASCHRCPTTSCQYKFGNYYGTGYPCVNLEGLIPGTTVNSIDQTSEGEGVQVVVTSDYGADQIMKFCDTDAYAVSTYQADSCTGERFATIVQPKTCTHCQILRCISPKFMLRYIDFNMQQEWFDLTLDSEKLFECQDTLGQAVTGVPTLSACYSEDATNSIVYVGPDSADEDASWHSVKLTSLNFDALY